jgi:integrase/recombinase XerD
LLFHFYLLYGGEVIVKVQEVIVGQATKYMLVDENGTPVIPVTKYLKYLDNTSKANNTLKSYCHHLKLFFQFLKQKNKSYKDADIDLLSEFISWLRNPHQHANTIQLKETKAKRAESTVNTILTCIIGFYDYLMRVEDYEKDLSDKIKKQISNNHRSFKPFLHHISKGKTMNKNILKIKEPRRKILTLSKKQVQAIHDACSNIRDELLIRILYEGGLRIGEALSLWIEDFDTGTTSVRVRKSKTTNGQGRKVYISADTINLFQDYLIDIHDSDTNFVFINLSGPNKGNPLNYRATYDVVERVKRKTGINFTPHMLRHTYATELHEHTDISIIQKLLGHANIQTTIHTYVHPSDETIRKEWEKARKSGVTE